MYDFKERFARRHDLIQLFLEIQIQMAFSDGVLATQEKRTASRGEQITGDF